MSLSSSVPAGACGSRDVVTTKPQTTPRDQWPGYKFMDQHKNGWLRFPYDKAHKTLPENLCADASPFKTAWPEYSMFAHLRKTKLKDYTGPHYIVENAEGVRRLFEELKPGIRTLCTMMRSKVPVYFVADIDIPSTMLVALKDRGIVLTPSLAITIFTRSILHHLQEYYKQEIKLSDMGWLWYETKYKTHPKTSLRGYNIQLQWPSSEEALKFHTFWSSSLKKAFLANELSGDASLICCWQPNPTKPGARTVETWIDFRMYNSRQLCRGPYMHKGGFDPVTECFLPLAIPPWAVPLTAWQHFDVSRTHALKNHLLPVGITPVQLPMTADANGSTPRAHTTKKISVSELSTRLTLATSGATTISEETKRATDGASIVGRRFGDEEFALFTQIAKMLTIEEQAAFPVDSWSWSATKPQFVKIYRDYAQPSPSCRACNRIHEHRKERFLVYDEAGDVKFGCFAPPRGSRTVSIGNIFPGKLDTIASAVIWNLLPAPFRLKTKYQQVGRVLHLKPDPTIICPLCGVKHEANPAKEHQSYIRISNTGGFFEWHCGTRKRTIGDALTHLNASHFDFKSEELSPLAIEYLRQGFKRGHRNISKILVSWFRGKLYFGPTDTKMCYAWNESTARWEERALSKLTTEMSDVLQKLVTKCLRNAKEKHDNFILCSNGPEARQEAADDVDDDAEIAERNSKRKTKKVRTSESKEEKSTVTVTPSEIDRATFEMKAKALQFQVRFWEKMSREVSTGSTIATHVVRFLSAEPELIDAKFELKLDAEPLLLSLAGDQCVDLRRRNPDGTYTSRRRVPSDFIMAQGSTVYNSTVNCPRVHKFIKEIFLLDDRMKWEVPENWDTVTPEEWFALPAYVVKDGVRWYRWIEKKEGRFSQREQRQFYLHTQTFFGYCITGLSSAKLMGFHLGHGGNNGKTALTRMLGATMGEYFQDMDSAAFALARNVNPSSHTEALMPLKRARLGHVDECSNDRTVISKELIKKVVNPDTKIPLRGIFSKGEQVRIFAKLIFNLNNFPKWPVEKDTEQDSFWERIYTVFFNAQFKRAEFMPPVPTTSGESKDEKKSIIREAKEKKAVEVDPEEFPPYLRLLQETLTHELTTSEVSKTAFLNWVLEGFTRFYYINNQKMNIPAAVRVAAQHTRSCESPLIAWRDERLEYVEGDRLGTTPALKDYLRWKRWLAEPVHPDDADPRASEFPVYNSRSFYTAVTDVFGALNVGKSSSTVIRNYRLKPTPWTAVKIVMDEEFLERTSKRIRIE